MHDQVFVMSSGGVERGLPFLTFLDVDQVIGIVKIKFCEEGGKVKQLEGRWDKRQGVVIDDEAPVISAEPQSLIFLNK